LRAARAPEDYGLRDAAYLQAFDLKKALDEVAGGQSNFVFLGDLNTVGIDDSAPYDKTMDLTAAEEVAHLGRWAARRGMVIPPKDEDVTWWNGSDGYDPTNLDHVVAAEHLDIRRSGRVDGVAVLGWPKLPAADRDQWLTDFSDHALLYFEVW
jgi:hypothetical protein